MSVTYIVWGPVQRDDISVSPGVGIAEVLVKGYTPNSSKS